MGTETSAQAAIERVRQLHQPVMEDSGLCIDPDCDGECNFVELLCDECDIDYPCPTIKRLDGELA